MKRKLPKHVKAFIDRTGRPRHYFRHSNTALPGLPYSTEFMDAYGAALKAWEAGRAAPTTVIGASRTQPGTIAALILSYYGSADFRNLAKASQKTYRNALERIRIEYGIGSVVTLERKHVLKMMDKKAEHPGAANELLKMMKLLMGRAIDMGMRKDDPTIRIRRMKIKSGGFIAWEEQDIVAFYAAHAEGTRARLALDLLLFTGQRRSDVICMGRQHVKNDVLSIRQQKTGTAVSIPLHAHLKGTLDARPQDNLTFLLTQYDKPFQPESFTNWFRVCVREAGLREDLASGAMGLSPHGLRKACSRRLAQAGCTPHQIKAITGHKKLDEIVRYTEAVDQMRLAHEAMNAIAEHGAGTKTVKPNSLV
ncbi:tyrosine-type recombinase/integrase [Mesorhizobium sp. LjNodule214]|uniref:tyrosine-type recombinase/integrase n=1 Tax=Mesorhizobium sp. LjNodule214 TaxID=3342252 RepID=UPI003ED15C1B